MHSSWLLEISNVGIGRFVQLQVMQVLVVFLYLSLSLNNRIYGIIRLFLCKDCLVFVHWHGIKLAPFNLDQSKSQNLSSVQKCRLLKYDTFMHTEIKKIKKWPYTSMQGHTCEHRFSYISLHPHSLSKIEYPLWVRLHTRTLK